MVGQNSPKMIAEAGVDVVQSPADRRGDLWNGVLKSQPFSS